MERSAEADSVWLWLWRKAGRSLIVLIVALTALDMLSKSTDWRFIAYGHFLINAIPAILLFAIIFALTHSARISAFAAWLICAPIYLFNHVLYIYRATYLVPKDVRFLFFSKDIYAMAMKHQTIGNTLVPLMILGVMAGLFAWLGSSRFQNQKSEFPMAMRAAIISVAAAISLFLLAANKSAEPVMRGLMMAPNAMNMGEQLKYGLFNHLYLTAARSGLNTQMFEGRPDPVLEYTARQRPSAPGRKEASPDIVVIMAESIFDPLTLRTEFRADPLAELRAGISENRMDGLTRVQTIGGGTWVSTHTFLTGLPGPLFGTYGRSPFAFVDDDTRTIAKALRNLGYKTYVLYPVNGTYIFNAREGYLKLGFDEFIDIDEIRARFGMADGSIDGQILNAADRISSGESPSFVFVVTLDMHSPYRGTGKDQFVDESVGTPALREYFRRQSKFSARIQSFIDRQDARDDHALLAVFGDHLPPIHRVLEDIGFREDVEAPLLRTPYLLHSTYGKLDSDFPDLDLGYLAGLVLDQAGLDGGEYFRVNAAVRDLCRGRFVDCEAAPELLRSYYAYLGTNIPVRYRPEP